MKNRRNIFLKIIVLFFVLNVNAQTNTKDTLHVLFVGNSYTYFWNMPQMVNVMAESNGESIVTKKSTKGGAYWKEHWEGERGLKTKELITNQKWDYVVLQNNSMSSIENRDEFMEYGQKLIEFVKKSGATPLLYATWSRKYNPLMERQVTEAYRELGENMNVNVIPVGDIWKNIREIRPDLELYHPDSSHPSNVGSYVIAIVMYGYLTKKSVSKVPERLQTTDKFGEELYLNILMKNDADFIQQVVDEYLFP